MRAVERTTKQFVNSVKALFLPGMYMQTDRSVTRYGHSNYVFLCFPVGKTIKVRISDHEIGMRRAHQERYDYETVYIRAGDKPETWAAWLDDLRRRKGVEQFPAGPLFDQAGDQR